MFLTGINLCNIKITSGRELRRNIHHVVKYIHFILRLFDLIWFICKFLKERCIKITSQLKTFERFKLIANIQNLI